MHFLDINFDCKAIKKHINADISIEFDDCSIKFHLRPLEEVVFEEINSGKVDAVPADYFD